MMTGSLRRPLKFNMGLHSYIENRFQEPTNELALLKQDVGLEQHPRLKRHLLTVRVDVRPVQGGDHLVGRLFQLERSGNACLRKNCLRDADDLSGIGAKTLKREGVV